MSLTIFNEAKFVVLEEFLEGTEFSFQSVTNGKSIIHSIMDFKRVGEGNMEQILEAWVVYVIEMDFYLVLIQQIYQMPDM